MESKKIKVQLAKEVLVRFCLVAAFLFIITRGDNRPSTSVSMLPTENLDLRLVRLYQQTNGAWTSDDQEVLNTLLTAQHNYDLIARRLPLMDEPSIPVLWMVAEQQRDSQDWQGLEQTLKALLARDPANPEANLWLALVMFPDAEGIQHLEIASSTPHEKQPLAAALFGIVRVAGYTPADIAIRLVESSEWAFAERFLTLQIEQNNLDARAYAYRGFVQDSQGKNGLSDIQQAIALEPTLPLGFYMLGLHERKQGNTAESIRAFQDAYLLEPNNPALAAEVATAYQLTGDFESAEEWYSLAVSLAPEEVRFISLQAAFYAESDYLLDGRGFDFIRQATENHPEVVSLLASLGRAYYENGQFEEAESVLQQALLLAPDDARTRYFLGNLTERQGNRAAAVEHYSVVIQTDNPYTQPAQTALSRLPG